jgi:hypothetical protein
MAYTHTHPETVTTSSGTIGAPVSVTGTGRASISQESITTGTSNQQLLIAFPVTGLSSIVIYSTYAITLKINSSGSPDQTLSIQAGEALIWRTGGYYTCPIDQAVTTMYVSNSSGSTTTLDIEAIDDGTP